MDFGDLVGFVNGFMNQAESHLAEKERFLRGRERAGEGKLSLGKAALLTGTFPGAELPCRLLTGAAPGFGAWFAEVGP